MSVYVDKLFRTVPTKQWPYNYACHLLADSVGELILFAVGILNLKASWRQKKDKPVWRTHFDLTPNKRVLAIKYGAIEFTKESMLEYLHRHQDKIK